MPTSRSPASFPTLMKLAEDAYSTYKEILKECGASDTTGTCMFASISLCELALRRNFEAIIRGGDGINNGGLFNEFGGHGHYWCEITLDGLSFYIDISAEQFGYSSYIVKNVNDVTGWPRYIPGDQTLIDHHIHLAFTEGLL
ncbi:hypothetical protein [Escherichia coli]|uniref:hypothetical protein n=1 Tax=Escherichia coli TaxID=562 RepID=UPI003EE673BF